MVPKLLTIVADCYGNSNILAGLKKNNFILFSTPSDQPPDGWPGKTLIYGYSLAKQLFEFVSIGDTYISDNISWTFNEFESQSDVWVHEWINTSLNDFFEYTSIVGKYSDIDEQLSEIEEPVFIYNGNHTLYLLVKSSKCVYSWPHEEISYRLDIKPTALAATIVKHFNDRHIVVYAWASDNLETIDYEYNLPQLNITDLVYATTNYWITKRDIKETFGNTRQLTTPEFMLFIAHIPQLYEQFDFKDYARRYLSGDIDQLFSRAEIYINRDNLLLSIKQRNRSGIDARTLEKVYSALDTNNMVQIPYNSRNKVTGRMFPVDGAFNPITISDQALLEAITSRHESGVLVSFDFVQFEPRIISNILKLQIEGDIHTKAASVLNIDRDNAKKINNMVMYGASEVLLADQFGKYNVDGDAIERYLQMMEPTIQRVSEVSTVLSTIFNSHGFIRNPFGRIVYPHAANSAFNNYIQSTAAEIFNEACSKVFDLLANKRSKLFMHRFDNLYVDIHPDETDLIDKIQSIMKNDLPAIKFEVKISAGKTLATLQPIQHGI